MSGELPAVPRVTAIVVRFAAAAALAEAGNHAAGGFLPDRVPQLPHEKVDVGSQVVELDDDDAQVFLRSEALRDVLESLGGQQNVLFLPNLRHDVARRHHIPKLLVRHDQVLVLISEDDFVALGIGHDDRVAEAAADLRLRVPRRQLQDVVLSDQNRASFAHRRDSENELPPVRLVRVVSRRVG